MVAKTSFFRVPQLTERLLPFSVLVGAMACYLALSRRNELVVARAAGMSAWQFVAPAVIVRLRARAAGDRGLQSALGRDARMVEAARSRDLRRPASRHAAEHQRLLGAAAQRRRPVDHLRGLEPGTGRAARRRQRVHLRPAGHELERIEAKSASLEPGHWRLEQAVVYASGAPPRDHDTYLVKTNLTAAQVRESFSTPETVPFWELPAYIEIAERSGLVAAGYKLQYQLLIARPFLLSAMVLLACSVSLRFFRFGGVAKMVLSGVAAGFLLYVLSKVTEDLSKAELMHPAAAAWLPVLAGGLTGFVVLLYQEDG